MVNISGSGERIEEPDVRHMLVSHDGKWLATVDEWSPQRKNFEFLLADEDQVQDEEQRRREVYLRFWLWNSETKDWQMVTRVDSPHASSSVQGAGAGRVHAFAVDPSSLGFASLGEDAFVRIWRPRIRRRNGIVVRDKNARELVTWHCHYAIPISNPGHHPHSIPLSPSGPIAFSDDGSLLVVPHHCCPTDGLGIIQFIDPRSGNIERSRPGLYTGELIAMGIVDRYLILLSEYLMVWDIVDDELHFGYSLRPSGLSDHRKVAATHLTVDQRHHTFALAVPVCKKEKRKTETQIAVFDPSYTAPLFTTSIPNEVTSLLGTPNSKSYVVLDTTAVIRVLSPKSAPFTSKVGIEAEITAPRLGLEKIYGRVETRVAESRDDPATSEDDSDVITPPTASMVMQTALYGDDDAAVVSQQQLSGVFDVGPAFAMPPVEHLFERVAGLFAKRAGAPF